MPLRDMEGTGSESSGDHEGFESIETLLVILVWFIPSASIT